MEINTEQPLKGLKDQILEYIELKTELARLTLVEYVAKIVSFVFAAIVGIILISLVLLSIFIAISFFIGQWLHSYGLGFLISAAVYLLLLWYFSTAGKRKVQNYMVRKILEQTDTNSNE
jgi:uncharacterized membrane protein YqjE